MIKKKKLEFTVFLTIGALLCTGCKKESEKEVVLDSRSEALGKMSSGRAGGAGGNGTANSNGNLCLTQHGAQRILGNASRLNVPSQNDIIATIGAFHNELPNAARFVDGQSGAHVYTRLIGQNSSGVNLHQVAIVDPKTQAYVTGYNQLTSPQKHNKENNRPWHLQKKHKKRDLNSSENDEDDCNYLVSAMVEYKLPPGIDFKNRYITLLFSSSFDNTNFLLQSRACLITGKLFESEEDQHTSSHLGEHFTENWNNQEITEGNWYSFEMNAEGSTHMRLALNHGQVSQKNIRTYLRNPARKMFPVITQEANQTETRYEEVKQRRRPRIEYRLSINQGAWHVDIK